MSIKVLICGSGKEAHIMAGLASSRPNIDVSILAIKEDEAQKWTTVIESEYLVVTINKRNDITSEVKSKPGLITKTPNDVVPESQFIIFAMPPSAQTSYLETIAPHMMRGVTLVGLPGYPGFERLCADVLGEKRSLCTIICFETNPWDSVLTQFGSRVEVLATKPSITVATSMGHFPPKKPALSTLQCMLGEEPAIRNALAPLELCLTPYSYFYSCILYGRWKDGDSKPVHTEPKFFSEVTDATLHILSCCSKEFVDIAEAIMKERPDVDLTEIKPFQDWYMEYFKRDCEDSSSLLTAVQTNRCFAKLIHPVKKTERGRFLPEYKTSFLAEDVPYNLVVVRGIASLVDIATPKIDELLNWCQEKLGKQYLANKELKGKDINSTRCPQQLGFNSVDDMINKKRLNGTS